MNAVKAINKGVWVVKESTALSSLAIAEGAGLAAPEGKSLTMTVDGVGTAIKPGIYKGDIFITVTDKLIIESGGMRKGQLQELRAAILIEDGKYVPEKSVPAIVKGGKVTNKSTVGVSMTGCENNFNGIIVKGDSEYTIEKVNIDFEGEGDNDFIGFGAGIMCIGNAKVTVNDSDIEFTGAWRCGFHGGGNSVTTLNNCRISNISPFSEKKGPPTWALAFGGSNRVTQCCDKATIYYNNCYVRSNGWGVLCVDGGMRTRIYAKDSTIELKGPRANGYGLFSIGDCFVSYDNCTVNVQGYPLLMGGHSDKSDAEITNGSVLNSNLYGVMMFRLQGGEVKVNKGAALNTASSSFLVKGANAYIKVDDAKLNPANGVILQLMDNDDVGMGPSRFLVPLGVDSPIPGRDLTKANPEEDVFMTVSNMKVKGDFYNSTTSLKPNCREKAPMPDMPAMPAGESAMPARMMDNTFLQGVKNLDLKFANAEVNGIISAATAAYKEGLAVIEPENCKELGAVKQTAAEPVNNGVIVSFDKDSIWTVAGTSYLTSLSIAKGAVIKAPKGKKVTMTVDGMKKEIAAGKYTGKIVLKVS